MRGRTCLVERSTPKLPPAALKEREASRTRRFWLACTRKQVITIGASVAQASDDGWVSATIPQGVETAALNCTASLLNFLGRDGLADEVGLPVVVSQFREKRWRFGLWGTACGAAAHPIERAGNVQGIARMIYSWEKISSLTSLRISCGGGRGGGAAAERLTRATPPPH